MNEETSVKTPGFFLPIAIALVGVVLGIIAIYLAVSGSGAMKDDLMLKLTEATDKVSQYETRISELEERVRISVEATNTASMKARSLEEAITKLAQQTQNVVNQLGKEIADLKTGGRSASTSRTSTTAAAPSSGSAETPAAAGSTPQAAASGETYIVKSGDTFTKIARILGVTIADIEKANPNVSSNRLQVGQKLNVPAKQ